MANAQSLSQRIEHVRHERRRNEKIRSQQRDQARRRMAGHLAKPMDHLTFKQVSVKAAFERWQRASGVSLVIHWRRMRQAGVDPDRKITLRLDHVPARGVLRILMKLASPHQRLIYQSTPWYVRVMTKAQANRINVIRIYPIGDLIHEVPNFTNAPKFDLNSALSNTSSGGSSSSGQGGPSGGSGGSGLFTDEQNDQRKDQPPTRRERAGQLVDAIEHTVEPDLWNAGTGASMRYYDGRLIVRAPRYVQRQIGTSTGQAIGTVGR